MRDKMPLHSLPEYNLFGLEGQTYESSKVVVLPVPYDSTVSYRSGTREGPQAIINASRNIELYSHELGGDPSKIGIYTLNSMEPDVSSPENMIARIRKEVGMVLEDGKVPLLLGGEHTITLGALQALKERDEEMSIVHFDAHTDTRDELFGSRYMHATVMARAMEMFPDVFQVGIRSIDSAYAAKADKKKIIFAEQVSELGAEEVVSRIAKSTKRKIYLTFDYDALDSGEMPSVGTPEPGGMRFSEVTAILKGIADKKQLVGLDFVELCPTPYMHAPDYLAAKLIYIALGYFFKSLIK